MALPGLRHPRRGANRAARLLACALVAIGVTAGATTSADGVVARRTFTQPAPIALGDPSLAGGQQVEIPGVGNGAPYPAEAVQETAGDRLVDVDVLVIVDHERPDDLTLRLVGPQGQQVTLMANAGGQAPVEGGDITFDDDAPLAVPDEEWRSGAFRPAAYGDPTATTTLSVFDGTDPAGTWQLFVDDDAEGAGGHLSWDLELSVATVPYPSSIQVTGLGPVTDVDLTLHSYSAEFPNDVDLLLVGPRGQQATVMSDAGGVFAVTELDLTLDDEAADPVPTDGTPTSGRYRPTNGIPLLDEFWTPAPAATGDTELGVFDGTDPNGTWQLFAVDDGPLDRASLAGWSLHIESDEPVVPTPPPPGVPPPSAPPPSGPVGDTTSPRPTTVKPRQGAKNVSPGVKVAVVASEPLDGSTVTRRTVVLAKGRKTVKAKVVLKKGTMILLTPRKPLTPGRYQASVTTRVTDLAGNRFDARSAAGAQPLRWRFAV